ncbi:rhodanese-like domain-containing protein [Limibacter armeniacum]|uniref:rhodanese-like domain-containing protein n=1 Tax=Limibacter armeniacum TaxID=466084 RepID=UPI002FE6ACC8
MKEITVQDLKKLQDENADFQLIDVREQVEFDEAHLNGELIPLGEFVTNIEEITDKISKDKKVVVHCRSGKRSAHAIELLEAEDESYDNLYNLKGGILAYIDEYGL